MMACFNPTYPEHMTADDRVAEVAAILAGAILRLRRRHALGAPSTAQISSDFAQTGLEVPADLRLHGQHG
jgi:hypothetical protein